MKQLFSKVINNPTLMSWSSYFVQFGSGLIVLPLILTKFDKTDQSFWFLVGTIRGFAMLADIGFGNVIVRAVAYFNAGMKNLPKNIKEFESSKAESKIPNYQGLSELLSTLNFIYLLLALIVFILVASGGVLTVWNLFTIAGHPVYLWLSYIFVGASTVIYILTVLWQSFMNGLNYVANVHRFNTMIGIVRITAFSVMLISGLGIEFLTFYILMDSFVTFFYFRYFIKSWFRKSNIKSTGRITFHKKIFDAIWPVTWKTGGIQWGNYMLENGTSLIAAQMQNVTLMASFLFTQRVLLLIRRTSEAPFYSHIPVIYGFMAEKDYSGLKKKVSVYIFTSVFLLVTALLTIGLAGNILLDFFRIDTKFVSSPIFIFMAISLMFQVHASFHGSIYISTNNIPFLWHTIVSGALILCIGYFTFAHIGLLGLVILQFLVLMSWLNWYQVKIALKLVNWPVKKYIHDFFKYGIQFYKLKMISLVSRKY